MTSFLGYATWWVFWTLGGLLCAFVQGVGVMLVTGLSLGLTEGAFEALGWPIPLIVYPVVLYGAQLVNVALVFRDMWEDRPRPSTWIVGRGRATLVHKDDFGKLWGLQPGWGGEEVCVVEVVNATPEPDGSYRHYFLHVPPWVGTAREAVAWTFGFAGAHEFTVTAES